MKKFYYKIMTFCCLLFISTYLLAQAPSLNWARTVGGPSYERCFSVAVDPLGNVITTGQFALTVDFDPGPGIYNLTTGTYFYGYDVYVQKLDAAGNLLWAKQFGDPTSSGDLEGSVTTDAWGNVYFTIRFNGTIDADPGPNVFNLVGSGTLRTYSFGIIKLDSQGNFIWGKMIESSNQNANGFIKLDAASNVYAAGWFRGTTDFDPGPGNYVVSSLDSTKMDAYLLKLDSSGNFKWVKTMNSAIFIRVVFDATGNMYTMGTLTDTTDADPGPSTFPLTTKGNPAVFITKFNSIGDFVWTKRIGGVGNEQMRSNSIAVNGSGDIFLTGMFTDTADFDPGPGIHNLQSAGGKDAFVLKLNTSGNFEWAKRLGAGGVEEAWGAASDTAGNFYATGSFDNPTGVPYSDSMFLVKFDGSGNTIWTKYLTNASRSEVVVSPSGSNIYVTGFFENTCTLEPSEYLYSSGIWDVFILKYSQQTLPLHLLSFIAKKQDKTNLLNWTTAQEINVDRFEIERSSNGREFSKIGTVKAGRPPYSFTDEQPAPRNTNYYRLKMIDIDGQFTYSPVRMINYSGSFNVTLYPNPAKDNLQVQIEGDKNTGLQLLVLSADGKTMLSKSITANESRSLQSINISTLSKGSYLLKVIGSYEEKVMKFEKL